MIKTLFEKYQNLPIQMRASLWFLICSFMQKGISVITTPIFTRIMNTVEYGDFSVFNSWFNILTVFVTLDLFAGGFTQGLVKFSEDRKVYVSSLQGLTLTLSSLWTVIYLLFRETWNSLLSLTTVQMLAMLVMIWATAAFNFWATTQRVELRYKKLVIITIILSIAKPFVEIIFVLLAEDKVTARILGLALVELIGYSGLFIVQMKSGKTFFSKKYWKYSLLFNIPLVPHYLSQMVLNGADRIMIKDMVGASEAGIYGLAYSIALIMTLFNTALLQTIEPWIYEKIKEKRIEEISKVAYPALIIICIVNILLIALAPEAVAIFAPPSYYEAIWVIPPVAMSVYFMFAYGLFATFEFYYEKTKLIAFATLAVAIINILLNYVFIARFGFIAAGYTTLFCYLLYAIFHFIIMRKICNDQLDHRQAYRMKWIIFITIVFMISGFAFAATYNHLSIRYGLLLIITVTAIIKRKLITGTIRNFINLRRGV